MQSTSAYTALFGAKEDLKLPQAPSRNRPSTTSTSSSPGIFARGRMAGAHIRDWTDQAPVRLGKTLRERELRLAA